MNKAMGVLSGVAAAGKSVASDVVDAASRNVARVQSTAATPAVPRHQLRRLRPDTPDASATNDAIVGFIWRHHDVTATTSSTAGAHARPRGRSRNAPRTGAKRTLIGTISQIPSYLRLMGGLLTDPRVPALDKVLVGVAIAYVAMPIDLIPDFIPFIGQVDDVFILVLARQAADHARGNACRARSLGWRDRGSASDCAAGSHRCGRILSPARHSPPASEDRSIDATTAGRTRFTFCRLAALLAWRSRPAAVRLRRARTRRSAGAVTPRAARRSSRPIRRIPSKVRGFDVEIAQMIGRGLHRDAVFVQVAWASIEASVERGDFSIGMSGVEDRPELRARHAVSIPYFEFREVLAVRFADSARYRTLADLAGKRVATLGGTGAYQMLLDLQPNERRHPDFVRRRRASVQRSRRRGGWMRCCSTTSSPSARCGARAASTSSPFR